MKSALRTPKTLLALAAVGGLCAAAAAATPVLPPEQHEGAVGYITGGIGAHEARAFERALPRHALAIELLEHAGKAEAYTADAQVRIADQSGRTVLAAQAQGPFLLVDLPPGRYRIDATLHDRTLRKPVTYVTGRDAARATFEFPAHTD
jgi:hypothetical protein